MADLKSVKGFGLCGNIAAKLLFWFALIPFVVSCGTTQDRQDSEENVAPVTTVSIESGYHGPQTVILTCDDGDGSGCLSTYYTIDGTTPNRVSTSYTGPIAIWSGTTLKYYSIDRAGNTENVKTQIYSIGSIVIEDVQLFSAGWDHTVAIKNDGTLWVWGGNNFGQLGDGTTTATATPTKLGTDSDWLAVEAGNSFTIAIKDDGTLWAWGLNDNGQLGNGTSDSASMPMQAGTDTDWSVLSAGNRHALAIKNDGALWGWGSNENGQLGDGTTTDSPSPIQIGAGTSWSAISAGFAHSVALRNDGTLWTWGANTYGQLGDGTNSDSTIPIMITGTNWFAISAGDYHNVALKSDGTLWSWGQNWYGQLGDGTTITKAWAGDGTHPITGFITFDNSYPLRIGTYTDWNLISAGSGHSIAIKNDGRLWAWGLNVNGQLVDGTTFNNLLPLPVGPESFFPNILPKHPWAEIAAGSYHTIGLRTDGTLWSWGWNGSGQLGDGTTESTGGGSSPTNPTWKVPSFAYVVSDNVYAYSLDYTTGLLSVAGSPAAAGTNPTSAAIHTTGKFLYITDSSTDGSSPSYISTFGIDIDTGELTSIGNPVETLGAAKSINLDPLGRFAYVIGDDLKGWGVTGVAVYTIDPVSGEPINVGMTAYGARTMAFDPLGRFAYVIKDTLFSGTNIAVYHIDQIDGMLHGIGDNDRDKDDDDVLVDSAAHLAVDQSAQFLYVASTNPSVIRVFDINQTDGNIYEIGFLQGETDVSEFEFSSSNLYIYMLFSVNLNVLVVNQITGQVTDGGLEAAENAIGVVTEPTGKFVYVITPDLVNGYAIDPQHGTTMVIGSSDSPTAMATDASSGGATIKALLFASF
ncbi:MAG: beta-propeller fold lactonase family protein [SAR324 cluster bacterium]|nr:beta-propeller fold lactonase family protein [SAR324 cluster bacterium]